MGRHLLHTPTTYAHFHLAPSLCGRAALGRHYALGRMAERARTALRGTPTHPTMAQHFATSVMLPACKHVGYLLGLCGAPLITGNI